MQIWILTFNRPVALNRLISALGNQGTRVNILSNHPDLKLTEENTKYLNNYIINTLNFEESNSWCARSWNTILMKAFVQTDEVVCIQDDTMVGNNFCQWLNHYKQSYDFIWGPAGDQFFYLKKHILKNAGYWDERYIGCYCGDADWMKRVFMTNDPNRLSVVDTHDWGFVHNDIGVRNVINTHAKNADPNYENQHEELERKASGTVVCSQTHFKNKWGRYLNGTGPVNQQDERFIQEIDWYPWFTRKYLQ